MQLAQPLLVTKDRTLWLISPQEVSTLGSLQVERFLAHLQSLSNTEFDLIINFSGNTHHGDGDNTRRANWFYILNSSWVPNALHLSYLTPMQSKRCEELCFSQSKAECAGCCGSSITALWEVESSARPAQAAHLSLDHVVLGFELSWLSTQAPSGCLSRDRNRTEVSQSLVTPRATEPSNSHHFMTSQSQDVDNSVHWLCSKLFY